MSRRCALVDLGFLLVPIVLLAIIMAVMSFARDPDAAKRAAARVQIQLLVTALAACRLDVGVYPTTEEGLGALRVSPPTANNWKGPYIKKEIPLDPWGTSVHLSASGTPGRQA